MDWADEKAIRNLIHTYPYLVDSADFAGLGEMFAQAEVWSNGALLAARDGAAMARSMSDWVVLYADGTPRTRHCIFNLIIEDAGPGQARARSCAMVFQQTDHLPLQPVIAADYEDRLERADGVWRFVYRHIRTTLHGNLSAHGRDLSILPAQG